MQMKLVRDIFIYKELGQIRRMCAIITNGSATVTESSGTKKRAKNSSHLTWLILRKAKTSFPTLRERVDEQDT